MKIADEPAEELMRRKLVCCAVLALSHVAAILIGFMAASKMHTVRPAVYYSSTSPDGDLDGRLFWIRSAGTGGLYSGHLSVVDKYGFEVYEVMFAVGADMGQDIVAEVPRFRWVTSRQIKLETGRVEVVRRLVGPLDHALRIDLPILGP